MTKIGGSGSALKTRSKKGVCFRLVKGWVSCSDPPFALLLLFDYFA